VKGENVDGNGIVVVGGVAEGVAGVISAAVVVVATMMIQC